MRREGTAKLALALVAATVALVVAACGSPDLTARDVEVAPDRTTFAPVGLALMQRCGSIDCHGSPYRNLRLLGFGGARLDPKDRPDAPETTQLEQDGNFDSVVDLEPEIMSAVVTDHGAKPERLTLVRKGRNQEHHKGGQRIVPGDDADVCILSWLAGNVDTTACERVANAP